MKVTVGAQMYTDVYEIKFAPEIDPTGDTVPLCSFEAVINTTADPELGGWAVLEDDSGNLYANYILSKTERISRSKLRIIAYSTLYLLESSDVMAHYLDNVTVTDAFIAAMGGIYYTLDPVLASGIFSGYVEKTNGREYLHLLCDANGGYVSQAFRSDIGLLSFSETATLIPYEDTFFIPEASYDQPASSVTATIYEYTELPSQEKPDNGEEWVLVNGTYYVVGKGWSTATNPDYPAGSPAKAITYENSLVTAGNYSNYVTRKARFHFPSRTYSATVINNAQYAPGDLVMLYTSRNTIVSGYIKSCDFVFGKQNNVSKITIIGVQDVEVGGSVTIRYVWQNVGTVLETENIYPEDYSYRYYTRYLDKNINGHRYIFRPLVEYEDIVVTDEPQTITINCDPALDYYEGVLHILSVDSVGSVSESGETIVVVDGQ